MAYTRKRQEATPFWIMHWDELQAAKEALGWMVGSMGDSVTGEARTLLAYAEDTEQHIKRVLTVIDDNGMMRDRYVKHRTLARIAKKNYYAVDTVQKMISNEMQGLTVADRVNGNMLRKRDQALLEFAACWQGPGK